MVLAIREQGRSTTWSQSKISKAVRLLAQRQQASAESDLGDRPTGYLRDLYRTALLTATEERVLFERMDELKLNADQLRARSDDSPSELVAYELRQVDRELELIRNHLVESNLRLVVSVARKFSGVGTVEFHDLVSEGNSILMKAVDLFQVKYGYRFSTYATTALKRGFYNYCHTDQRHKSRFVNGVAEGLHQQESENDATIEIETLNDIKAALKTLDERERKIVMERFGLEAGVDEKTFREIGADFGLSKERIRQIMYKALRKMRIKLEKRYPVPS